MSKREVLTVSSYIAARTTHAAHTKDFPDTVTFGRCYKPEEEDAANGPIASVCCVEQSAAESDGFGTLKTTYGQRCTPSSSGGGSTSTLAKEPGTIQGSTPKVGFLTNAILLATS